MRLLSIPDSIIRKWKKYDLIFTSPCYFHSYFLQKSLIKQGFRVTTIIPSGYPEFLDWYGQADCIRLPPCRDISACSVFSFKTFADFVFNKAIAIYRLYLYSRSKSLMSLGHVTGSFPGLFIKYFARTRQYCFISSCAAEARMTVWQNIEDCDICNHCGLRLNNKHYCQPSAADRRRKERLYFSSGEITTGAFPFTEVPHEIITPFISCDPEHFNPSLRPPPDLLIQRDSPEQLLILHSYGQDPNRLQSDGLNPIKGTHEILRAITRLKNDGVDVKLINISGYHQRLIRYYQVQADICVDELRYGWFGSTPLECASLGIPTIVFINYLFHQYWASNYPELVSCFPFLSANVDNIYEVLLLLCQDPSLRMDLRKKSLEFAHLYLDPDKNAANLASHLRLKNE